MSRMQFFIELRGQTVTVDCAVAEADRSVGIMSEGAEDVCLTDAYGNALYWELTDVEFEAIDELVAQGRDND